MFSPIYRNLALIFLFELNQLCVNLFSRPTCFLIWLFSLEVYTLGDIKSAFNWMVSAFCFCLDGNIAKSRNIQYSFCDFIIAKGKKYVLMEGGGYVESRIFFIPNFHCKWHLGLKEKKNFFFFFYLRASLETMNFSPAQRYSPSDKVKSTKWCRKVGDNCSWLFFK